MTETPRPIEFDPGTLETGSHFDYTDDVDGDLTTAHPFLDRKTGREYHYITKFGPTSQYKLVSTEPNALERSCIAEVDIDRPAYMHSLMMESSCRWFSTPTENERFCWSWMRARSKKSLAPKCPTPSPSTFTVSISTE